MQGLTSGGYGAVGGYFGKSEDFWCKGAEVARRGWGAGQREQNIENHEEHEDHKDSDDGRCEGETSVSGGRLPYSFAA